jgi:hypothetical protein
MNNHIMLLVILFVFVASCSRNEVHSFTQQQQQGWSTTPTVKQTPQQEPPRHRHSMLGVRVVVQHYATTSSEDPSLSEEPSSYHRRRDLEPLFVWAVRSGVEFAHGVEMVEDNNNTGNWGVVMTGAQEEGTAIMTVPTKLILSSDHFTGMDVRHWMEQQTISSMLDDYHPKEEYLPECLLMLRLLEERSKGKASLWYPWLESLPTSFSTGLYMNDLERSHVQRMAAPFLQEQDRQWHACRTTILSLVHGQGPGIPSDLKEWLLTRETLQDTLRWAFSVVFTRSWRTPDGRQAILVPLGDLLNHDSQMANVQPCFRQDDASSASSSSSISSSSSLHLCLTKATTDAGAGTSSSSSTRTELQLTYGMSEHPARFLVIFGFCDVTAPYVDAHIVDCFGTDAILSEWPLIDTTQLVVSTTDGAIAEEVWNVFLYRVLQQYDPAQFRRLQQQEEEDDGDALLEELLMEWEWTVALELKGHIQRVLNTMYPQIVVNELDLWNHPRLPMIVHHNKFMRETFLRVLNHVNMVLEQASELPNLADASSTTVAVPTDQTQQF